MRRRDPRQRGAWHAACSTSHMQHDTFTPLASRRSVSSPCSVSRRSCERRRRNVHSDGHRQHARRRRRVRAGDRRRRRFAADADRDALMAAIKQGGTDAVRSLLATRPTIGVAAARRRSVPPSSTSYAARLAEWSADHAVTAEPIVFVGAGLPGAPAKRGLRSGSGDASRCRRPDRVTASWCRPRRSGSTRTARSTPKDYSDVVVRLVERRSSSSATADGCRHFLDPLERSLRSVVRR